MAKRIVVVVLFFLSSGVPTRAAAIDVVHTVSGLVSATSGSTPGIRVFKGIPYATPPVGDLRWRPPQPPPPWEGIRKADDFGPECMQSPNAMGGTMNYHPEWAWTPIDSRLSEIISSYWVNFATRGDPNGKDLPRWPLYSEKTPLVIQLGDKVEAVPLPHQTRLDFWDAFFAKEQSGIR